MNILVVTQYFWPENFRINDLVDELVKRGHQVTVVTGRPNYPGGEIFPEYLNNPSQFFFYKGARIHRVPMLGRGSGSFRLFLNYLSFVLGACFWGPFKVRGYFPDVIFVYEPSPVTVGLPALLLGHIKSCPVVFWVLDLWPETLAAVGIVKKPWLLNIFAHLVRFIYNRCTLVLGQSQSFLPSIARYCNNSSKVRYFPSWTEDHFDSQLDNSDLEVNHSSGMLNILFAGNIGDAQDFPAILSAAEILKHRKDIRWLIVGDGRRFDWLAEQVILRDLKDQIMLLGRFPVDRMPVFFAQADALLVSLKKDPTFSMTIPGKIQSYLSSGRPIIGMLDGEGANIIRQSRAGIVCPAGDSIGLARVIQFFADMPLRDRQKMGERGRAYAKSEFDRGILVSRLIGLFEESKNIYQQENLRRQ